MFREKEIFEMDTYQLFGMLAQAETEGNPIFGFLVLGGIAWLLVAVFSKKKSKYLVSSHTSVRKLK